MTIKSATLTAYVLPTASQMFIGAVAASGVASLVAAAYLFPISGPEWLYVAPGLVIAAAAAYFKMPVRSFRRGENSVDNPSMSLGLLPTFFLLLMYGPFVGALAGVVTALVATCYPRRAYPSQIVFSLGAVPLAICAASPLLMLTGLAHPGYALPLNLEQNDSLPVLQAIAILAAGALYFLVNTVLVATAITLTSAKRTAAEIYRLWHDNFRWMFPAYVAGASAAALLYILLPFAFRFWQAGVAMIALSVPIPFLIHTAARYHRDREIGHERYISELERSREEMSSLYTATVESFALAIDAKDRYTQEHIQRVKSYAVDLAEAMRLSDTERKAIEYGALLHDIGKLAIPETILSKPGKLTEEEFATMKTHAEIGAKILEPVRFPFPVIEVVRSHHERWDGAGYPDGLKGEEIPIGARILAVTDVYDALTSDRSYRRAWTSDETKEYLQKHSGTHFDPAVVNAFLLVLQQEDDRTATSIVGAVETSEPALAS